jgi:NitT/TauT family transport system ATP-binding protein
MADLIAEAPAVPPHISGTGSIQVRNLSHVYVGRDGASPALADVDFTVEPGRFVVLVGPSGCGKTSLLMMLAGLREHSEGTILCDARPVTGPDPDRIGVVFQEANLFPWLTALDNVRLPADFASRQGGGTASARSGNAAPGTAGGFREPLSA